MFCPQCRAEYRPGFHRCADRDIELVEMLTPALEEGSAQPSGLHDLRVIWIGDRESDCLEQCQPLKQANIPYEVAQLAAERRGRMKVSWRFELAVSAQDEQRAKELLQLPEKVVEWNSDTPEEDDESQALPEFPEGVGSDPEDEAPRRRSYLKAFHPDDASVEIWQAYPDGDSGVRAALQENYIRMRVEPQSDGSQRLFVLPEDETAAREIVREIVGDTPHP